MRWFFYEVLVAPGYNHPADWIRNHVRRNDRMSGFVTGSNSGANAMFAGLQAQTAVTLGAPALPVAASQNVSASLLTMASPARPPVSLPSARSSP